MPKTNINQYDPVAANNTDCNGVDTNIGWSPSNVGSAFRELMEGIASVVR